MRDHGAEQPTAPWYSYPRWRQLGSIGARVSGATLLAAGVVNSLAARRRKESDANQPDSDASSETRRDRGDDKKQHRDEADQKGGDSDRQQRRDREHGNGSNGDREEGNHHRNHDGAGRHHRQTSSDVDSEAKNNNNRNNNNNNNSNDNSNNNQSNNADDNANDGGNDHGNAGSNFFDSSLATKARRRAKTFDNANQDDAKNDSGVNVDVDQSGTSTHDTASIHFATGPDGIEVDTRNIHFTAAPTPTPTPFPRLELPARDRLDVFGDRVISAPTPTATSDVQAAPPAAPSVPDNGSIAPPPVEEPLDGDTSGGNNTTDFMS